MSGRVPPFASAVAAADQRECPGCRVRTDDRGAFRDAGSGRLCRTCEDYEDFIRRPSRAALLLLPATAAGAGVAAHFGPAWLALLLMVYPAAYGALCLHEAGHALVAAALGLRPIHVNVGIGPVIARLRLGLRLLEARLWPTEAMTVYAPPRQPGCRRRLAAAIVAGPLANLGVALVCLSAWPAGSTVEFGPVALVGLMNLLFAVFNLAPFSTRVGGMPIRSDGGQLLALPALGDRELDELHINGIVHLCRQASSLEQIRSVAACALHALGRYPEDVRLGFALACAELAQDDYDAAERRLHALRRRGVPGVSDVQLLERLAYLRLLRGRPEDVASGHALAQEAFDRAPWHLPSRITLGGLLVRDGRAAAGLELLRDRRLTLMSSDMQATAACLSVVAHAALGQLPLARRSLATAWDLGARESLLVLAENALARAGRPGAAAAADGARMQSS